MIGAITTLALLAALATAMATLSNTTIAREFPTYKGGTGSRGGINDFVVDQATRLAKYQQAATLFYYEAVLLWCAFTILVAATFFFDLAK